MNALVEYSSLIIYAVVFVILPLAGGVIFWWLWRRRSGPPGVREPRR